MTKIIIGKAERIERLRRQGLGGQIAPEAHPSPRRAKGRGAMFKDREPKPEFPFKANGDMLPDRRARTPPPPPARTAC